MCVCGGGDGKAQLKKFFSLHVESFGCAEEIADPSLFFPLYLINVLPAKLDVKAVPTNDCMHFSKQLTNYFFFLYYN